VCRTTRYVARGDRRRDCDTAASASRILIAVVVEVLVVERVARPVARTHRTGARPSRGRRIRRPAVDESKGGPLRIRRAVETGLPYGPTTRGVSASFGDATTPGAGRAGTSRTQRPDLQDSRSTPTGTPHIAGRALVARAPMPVVVAPLGHD
jgi:hypothetical protein